MTKARSNIVVCLTVGAFALPATLAAQMEWEVRGQMGFGGDEIANVQYSDGSDSDLKLGTYFSFLVGPSIPLWSSTSGAFELQAMAGWAGWSTGPANTDDRLSLNRFPLEVLGVYTHVFPGSDRAFRIGGGVTHHIVGDVGGSGSLANFSLAVENATAPVAEISMIFGILSAGLRYTHMENGVGATSALASGSSVGLFFGIATPRG